MISGIQKFTKFPKVSPVWTTFLFVRCATKCEVGEPSPALKVNLEICTRCAFMSINFLLFDNKHIEYELCWKHVVNVTLFAMK